MAQLTPDRVRHIAKLARLRLRDEEVETFAEELGEILAYVDILREVDTKGVEPTAQVTELQDVVRDDVLRKLLTSPYSLLSCSPLPVIGHQIQTPAAHG